jgi:O-antigen ligase
MTTSLPPAEAVGGEGRHLRLVRGEPRREEVAARRERVSLDLLIVLAVGAGFAIAYTLQVSPYGKLGSLLGLTLALGAASSALLNPSRFPLWLVAYLPFNSSFPFTVLGVSSFNMTTLLLGLSVVALLSSRVRRESRLRWGPFELLVLAFAGLGALGVLRALSLRHTDSTLELLFSYKRWIMPFYVFFVVRTLLESRKDLRDAVTALLWTAALVGAVVWFDGVQLGDRHSIDESRVGSLMGQANSMGAFLVYYGTPLFAFSLKMKRWTIRGACLGGFLLAVRGLLFTLSRGAYLALASGCAVVLVFANPTYLVLVGAGGAAAKTFPELFPSSVQARLGNTNEGHEIYDDRLEDNLDRSSADRLMLWRAGMAMIADNPLRGVGWHRFGLAVHDYTEKEIKQGDPSDAHNAYILVGAELGLPALGVMLLLMGSIGASAAIVYFRKKDPFDRALALAVLGSLVGVMVSCVFGSRFADEALISYFWILVALLRVLRSMRPDGLLFEGQA